MCYIGLAGGSAPSTPGRRERRRGAGSWPPSLRPSPGTCPARGAPGSPRRSGSARSPAAVKALPRLLRVRCGPTGDCRGRPCGMAFAGQPGGWPLAHDEQERSPRRRSVVAEHRRRQGGRPGTDRIDDDRVPANEHDFAGTGSSPATRCRWPATGRTGTRDSGRTRSAARGSKGSAASPRQPQCTHIGSAGS